tara:strand:+ start:245 stop:3340 length:3096 start_codon:yes stop_codon:yes gene_type:complete
MADIDPFKDIAYGDLNPIVKKKGKVYRDNETDSIEVLKDIAADEFQSETILGTGPYKAICLRVESAANGGTNTSTPALTWLDRLYESFGRKPEQNFTAIKAYIPEIHGSWLPAPKDFNDNAAINRYPTFVARQKGTGESPPEPGDFVWVDFGNRVTLDDPHYLGKLESDVGVKIAEAAAAAAFNCRDGLNMRSPGGDNIAVSNEPVAKIGPRKAPDYVPINIEKDRGKIPKGKGIFTGASLNPIKLSRHPVEKAVEAGVSWVSIYVYKIKQNGDTRTIDRDSLKAFIQEYHKRGIRCYIYGWAAIGLGLSYNETAFKAKHNGQEPEDLFIKNMIDLALYTGAFGIEIDAEEDMYARGTGILDVSSGKEKWLYSPEVIKRNEDFAKKLKQACKRYNLTLGFTSTTPNKNSPKKGHYYASWGKYCDYAVPQVYSASGFWGKNHWKKGYDRYKAEGFKNIIPGLGAYDVGPKGSSKKPKTAERMRWELHACYGQSLDWYDAVIWWAWPFLDKRNRWSVVKELGSGGTGQQDQVADSLNSDTTTISTSNAEGETTTAPVSMVGPSPNPPKTEQKNKSAEVIKEKKPGLLGKFKNVTDLTKQKANQYEGKEIEIRRQELFAFTDEKGAEIDRLLSVAGPNASVSAAPQDQQRYEQLVNTAKNKIQEILKTNADTTSNTKLIEQEIIGLKKQLKLVDNTGTTTTEVANLKRQISEKESKLKTINSDRKNKQLASSVVNNNCRRRGGSFASGPAGAKIPLSKFAGGNYPALLRDDLSVQLPSRKRKMGVNQIMIHQSGVHRVDSTVKILSKKGLSVHFTVSLDGKVRQHVALDEVAFHAAIAPGEQNTRTIGIEMVNRYKPDKAKYSVGNQPIIDNCIFTRGYGKGSSGKILSPAAYRGTAGIVRMPTQAACEAAWQLCKWLPTQISTLKLAFPGLTSKGFLWTGGNTYHPEKRYDDGITSHGRSIGSRWDGLFTEHYMVCRSLGHSPSSAFKRTIAAASSREPGMKGNKHYTNYHKGNTYNAKYFAWKGRNVKTFEA